MQASGLVAQHRQALANAAAEARVPEPDSADADAVHSTVAQLQQAAEQAACSAGGKHAETQSALAAKRAEVTLLKKRLDQACCWGCSLAHAVSHKSACIVANCSL
jgi:hypothetical protein